ncbi:hypothetical protein BDZ91DRAFT_33630 [Kalaharituber pfeilii]|nr:hypothetical protein BDZ91DRAFT_33630 [Kalaharituber pfeilii]
MGLAWGVLSRASCLPAADGAGAGCYYKRYHQLYHLRMVPFLVTAIECDCTAAGGRAAPIPSPSPAPLPSTSAT